MEQKQVIFVIHTLAVGGAERQISSVAGYLAQQGVDVTIALIDDAMISFELDSRVKAVCINQAVYEIPPENKSPCELFRSNDHPSVLYRLGRLAEKCKLYWNRVVHKDCVAIEEQEQFFLLHYARPLHLFLSQYPNATVISCMTVPNISTMMALQTLPNRAVFSDRTSPAFEYPPDSPICALKRKYYPRAQAAVFQTPEARDYYTWLPKTEKVIIPNFIRGEQFPPRFEGERRHEIVNFCRMHAVKNLPLLIDAFEIVLAHHPDYTLGIYGDGSIKEQLQALIDEKGLGNAVTLHPADLHIHEKVRDAAMFVSSSDREGISNSMLEALAIGLPTICTDCPAGGARMTIQPYENGLLVPVGDVQAMASAMEELIDAPALCERLSREAVRIKDRLTIDIIGKKWLQMI